MDKLREKDEKIFNWLEDAKAKGESVIYVSVGSECILSDWSIKAIKEGLELLQKKDKMRAIWQFPRLGSKPELAHPFGSDDDRFIVSAWLPQVEILGHPALKAGLTHCGFGGLTEFIMSGVPMVTFPHFGDQHTNANLIIDNGCGLFLQNNKTEAQPDYSKGYDNFAFRYDNANFTAQDFCDRFSRVLNENSFAENVGKLRCAGKTAGGRDYSV